MKTKVMWFGVLVAGLLAGCVASGPVGYLAYENRPGFGLIHVYRESKFAASGVTADVVVDGKIIGTIPNGSFVAAYLKPGPHVVEVKFGVLNKLWYDDRRAELTVADSDRKYVCFDVTMTSLNAFGPVANSVVANANWSTGLFEVTEMNAVREMQKLRSNNNPTLALR
jgi:hypothetical protein